MRHEQLAVHKFVTGYALRSDVDELTHFFLRPPTVQQRWHGHDLPSKGDASQLGVAH